MEERYSNSEMSELFNITTCSYIEPRFMGDYINRLDLEVVKDSLAEEGQEFQRQADNKTESTLQQPQDESLAKRRKLGSWLKKARDL